MNRQWFILDGTQQKGPFTEDAITEMVRTGILNDRTALWTEGMANWTALRDTPFSAVGFQQHQQPGRTEAPSQPTYSAPMANPNWGSTEPVGPDTVLYRQQNWLVVTPRFLKHMAQTIPIKNISRVSDFEMPFEFKNTLINGVLFFVGLWLIFTFSGWSILGLGVCALCGFNLKDIFKKHYVVMIEFYDGGEPLSIHTTELDFAVGLRDALHKAISMN